MKKGVFMGLATIDIIHYVDHHPLSDEKTKAAKQLLIAGGPATNAAITFSHFGNSSILISGLGNSKLTNAFFDDVSKYDVDLFDFLLDPNESPTISSIYVKLSNGDRSVVSVNASSKNLDNNLITYQQMNSSSIVLLDGHFMDSCIHAANIAQQSNIPIVFDGGSWKTGTDKLLSYVDYAICSDDFSPPGCKNVEDIINYIKSFGVKYIAITRGKNPIIGIEKEHLFEIPINSTYTILDTLGAGDIFHGSFCHFIAENTSFKTALLKSSEIASLSCQFLGPREWMNKYV